MRGFGKLVVLGVVLVTLLIVIDTIDAGKKQPNKREVNNSPREVKNKNNKAQASVKQEKTKKGSTSKNDGAGEENQQFIKNPKSETNKYNTKKGIDVTTKGRTIVEDVNTKSFQKTKKYKVIEQEPEQKFQTSKSKGKKSKSQNINKMFKSVKKTSQQKSVEENENFEKILSEELNNLKNGEPTVEDENSGNIPKRRKYKLVEVVLQDDGEEDQDGNETIIEVSAEDEEFTGEGIFEKTPKISHSAKLPKIKKIPKKSSTLQEDPSEEMTNEEHSNDMEEITESVFGEGRYSNIDSFSSRYESPASDTCRPSSEDPSRQGPKKLTLYVVEEEIDGQVRKRVVSEEDGVTMCEVADLLKETYGSAIPEE